MALEPDAIDLEGLPRTIGGGLKREPVEELLKRVQWEYSQLYYEHKRLKDEVEDRGVPDSETPGDRKSAESAAAELEAVPPAPVSGSDGSTAASGAQRPDGPVARIERTLRAEPLEIAPPAGEPSAEPAQVAPAQPIERAPHRDIDELARLVLAAAHRTSNELRESARRDCELMLKKTRERVAELEHDLERAEAKRTAELAELERDFERTKAQRIAELTELDEMMREIKEQMRGTLEVLIPERPEPDPDPEIRVVELPDADDAVTMLHSAEAPAENPAADGEAPSDLGQAGLEAAS